MTERAVPGTAIVRPIEIVRARAVARHITESCGSEQCARFQTRDAFARPTGVLNPQDGKISFQLFSSTGQRFGLLKVEGTSAHQLPAFAFCTGTPIVV
jgi:hypothetical protein